MPRPRSYLRSQPARHIFLSLLCLFFLFAAPRGSAIDLDAPLRKITIGICISEGGVAWQEAADACLSAVLVRFRDLNSRGGIDGKRVVPIVFYVPHDSGKIDAAARKILGRHPDMHAIIGLGSTVIGKGLAAAVEATRPCAAIFPISIDPAVEQFSPLFSIFLPDHDQQADALAEYIHREMNGKRLGILYDSRSYVQTALARKLAEVYGELGGDVGRSISYEKGVVSGDEDYRRYLRQVVRGKKPDIIAALGFAQEVAALIRQAPEVDVKARFCGGVSWNSDPLFSGSGYNLDGSFYLDFFMAENDRPEVSAFTDAVLATGQLFPGLETASGWDVAGLIAEAHRVDDPTPERVHSAFLDLVQHFPQVTGEAVMPTGGKRFIKRMRILRVTMDNSGPSVSVVANVVPGNPKSRLELVNHKP